MENTNKEINSNKNGKKIVLIASAIVLVLAVGMFFVVKILSKPKDLRVTNLTDVSFTLTWETFLKQKSFVEYWKCSSPTKTKIAFDDRDVANYEVESNEEFTFAEDMILDKGLYSLHSVTIGGLEDESEYCFKVKNGSFTYEESVNKYENEEYSYFDPVERFKVETLKAREEGEFMLPAPVYGSIRDSEGDGSVKEAVFYVSLQTTIEEKEYVSLPLSVVTNEEGNWSIDLSNARFTVPLVFGGKNINPDYTDKVYMVDAGRKGEITPRDAEISSSEAFTILLGDMTKETGENEEIESLVQRTFAQTSCPGQQVDSGKDGDIDWVVVTDDTDAIITEGECLKCLDGDGCGCLYGYANSKAKADVAVGIGSSCPEPDKVSGYDFQGQMDGRDEAEVVEDKLNPPEDDTPDDNYPPDNGDADSSDNIPGTSPDEEDDSDDNSNDDPNPNDEPEEELPESECGENLYYGTCSNGSVSCWDGFTPTEGGDGKYYCKSDKCAKKFICDSDTYFIRECKDDYLNLHVDNSKQEVLCTTSAQELLRISTCDGEFYDPDRGLVADSGLVPGGKDICFNGAWRVFLSEEGETCPLPGLPGTLWTTDPLYKSCVCFLAGARSNAYSFLIGGQEKCTVNANTGGYLSGNMTVLGQGEMCSNASGCVCLAKSGLYTRDYIIRLTDGDPVECNTGVRSNADKNVDNFAKKGLVNAVHAAETENEYRDVIYSPKTQQYVFEDKGVFKVESSDGETYYFNVPSAGEEIQLFVDVNNDGEYNSGDILIDEEVERLKVSKIFEDTSYEFKKGLNFVSFPIIPNMDEEDGYFKASDLLNLINNGVDKGVYSISKFDSSISQWVILSIKNGRLYGTDDFNIVPGEGYVIYSKDDRLIEIRGNTVADSVPLDFNLGWNLVGINGSPLSYTAKSLLESINKLNFTADNVTGWDTEVGRYEGYVIENRSHFGLDFSIDNRSSYFIRVVEGEGTWIP